MKPGCILLLYVIFGVNGDSPFVDKKKASQFLDRSKRSNWLWEEVKSGNQERECIEEDCTLEEAYEVFDNDFIANQFWKKYLRCNQALPRRYKLRGKIRIARQTFQRSERENIKLRSCIADKDQCNPFPCVRSNTADCIDSINSFECVCKNGYIGRKCESQLNECASNPCHGFATCEDEIGSFRCICDDFHEGLLCENEVNDCRNVDEKQCSSTGGTCQQGVPGEPYSCVCKPGYKGVLCDEDVDECAESSLCQQVCHNTIGSFTCSCNYGFLIDTKNRTSCTDIDECKKTSHGCEHSCQNTAGSFLCSCKGGYHLDKIYRRYCEDIDECAIDNGGCPKLEGGCGLDRRPCQTCNNYQGYYNCYCPAGFNTYETGGNCTDINECQSAFHGCQQICTNYPGGYKCECETGYKLNFNKKTCSDVNECITDGHGCSDRCKNNIGSYLCTCSRGYQLGEDERTCVDKDECNNGESRCSQTCINIGGGYRCECKPGFRLVGKYGCGDINECFKRPCGENGRCINEIGTFRCQCNVGFSGKLCVVKTNPCLPNPCHNDGDCVVIDQSFRCQCTESFTGDACEILLPDCAPGYRIEGVTCVDIDECQENTGICEYFCHNNQGSYSCSCSTGYVLNGNDCDDINECDDSPCQQICRNSVGSYKCACDEGYAMDEDNRTCHKIAHSCMGISYPTLQGEHLLLGTRKKDYVWRKVVGNDISFAVSFDFRTFDTNGILVALLDTSENRYIFLSIIDEQLHTFANLDGSDKKTSENNKLVRSISNGQWNQVTLRKRRNRVRVTMNDQKVHELRFSRDRFHDVDKIYYGGIIANRNTPTIFKTSDVYLQGCLRYMTYSGLEILENNETMSEHIGCFQSIEKGIYFDGSGFLQQDVRLQSNLRMRFAFKSTTAQGTIVFARDLENNQFTLTIDGNQLIAILTMANGQVHSSIFSTNNEELMCDGIWHVCDFTITPHSIRLHVDGLVAEEDIIRKIEIQFHGHLSIYLGGVPGTTRKFYQGSLRKLRINNKSFDYEDPVDMRGVHLYSVPSS